MNFTNFPRRRYLDGATPLEPMPRLSKALGGKVDLWIKRDDLLPGAAGGNKTRKLEFLIGEAVEQGANSLITCGAVQSNHCRLTLAWACKEGIDCHLILEERVPGSYDPKAGGNNFLFQLMGAASIRVVPGGSDMLAEMQKTAEELKQKGKRPYIIPGGGSNATGALGYALFAEEFMGQINEGSLKVDSLVVPSGSAGTHSGVVAGLFGNNAGIPVIGMNVSRKKDAQETLVHNLALKLSEKLSIAAVPRELVVCHDEYLGDGYSRPTQSMKEAVLLFARQEGILLDPVYSGKAAAGLLDFVRKGAFAEGSTVVFLHTGGDTALFVYQDYLV
ncbi:MAG: D-cysteine desulfhydrase [Spirochaetes bacterium]|nr:D-cysteine desulfhydrase [Spirochaetota bacterium]